MFLLDTSPIYDNKTTTDGGAGAAVDFSQSVKAVEAPGLQPLKPATEILKR